MLSGHRLLLAILCCLPVACGGDRPLPAWSAESMVPALRLPESHSRPEPPEAAVLLRLKHEPGETRRLSVRMEQDLTQAAEHAPDLRVKTSATLLVEESVTASDKGVATVVSRVLSADVEADGVPANLRREIEVTAAGRTSQQQMDALGLLASEGGAGSADRALPPLRLRLPEEPVMPGHRWSPPLWSEGGWSVSAEFSFAGMATAGGRRCAVLSVSLALDARRTVDATGGGARLSSKGVGRGVVLLDVEAGKVLMSEVATAVVQDGEVFSNDGVLRSRILETTRVETSPAPAAGG